MKIFITKTDWETQGLCDLFTNLILEILNICLKCEHNLTTFKILS